MCVAGAWGQGPLRPVPSTERAWDGLILGGFRKPTLLVELAMPGPMERTSKEDTAEGPRPAPALGTVYIKQQSKKAVKMFGKSEKRNILKQQS